MMKFPTTLLFWLAATFRRTAGLTSAELEHFVPSNSRLNDYTNTEPYVSIMLGLSQNDCHLLFVDESKGFMEKPRLVR